MAPRKSQGPERPRMVALPAPTFAGAGPGHPRSTAWMPTPACSMGASDQSSSGLEPFFEVLGRLGVEGLLTLGGLTWSFLARTSTLPGCTSTVTALTVPAVALLFTGLITPPQLIVTVIMPLALTGTLTSVALPSPFVETDWAPGALTVQTAASAWPGQPRSSAAHARNAREPGAAAVPRLITVTSSRLTRCAAVALVAPVVEPLLPPPHPARMTAPVSAAMPSRPLLVIVFRIVPPLIACAAAGRG